MGTTLPNVRGTPITNRLIDLLPAKERAHLLAACETVQLRFGETLDEPGRTIRDVYFPLTAFISLLARMESGQRIEVALAGNEGVYGVAAALGADVSSVQALVQGEGSALRISVAQFRREIARSPALEACIDHYIEAQMGQFIQAAGCNRFHVVEQRVARWMLMTADRAHSGSFRITHEFLAYMLGVRRVGVTKAASGLQRRSLITYARGMVEILDRKGLERASCSCYRSDLQTYARAFA